MGLKHYEFWWTRGDLNPRPRRCQRTERGFAPLHTLELRVSLDVLKDFEEFMSVNMQLRPETVKHTIQDIRRFLKKSDCIVSYKAISEYLKGYVGKAPKTYNQQLTSLRRFVRDFLGYEELISSFKLAPVDEPKGTDITKEQVRAAFTHKKMRDPKRFTCL